MGQSRKHTEKQPYIFLWEPIYFGIKGEAWYRLSELAEIDWALTTKQLFVSKGQKVTDRWLPAQSRIKARSSRVQSHLSTAHQQGRRPRHSNVPGPFFFFLPLWMRWVWSSEYNLIYASLHSAVNDSVRDWMNGCALKHWKRANLYSHMSRDTSHPSWQTISTDQSGDTTKTVSVYYPLSNSRHKGLLTAN